MQKLRSLFIIKPPDTSPTKPKRALDGSFSPSSSLSPTKIVEGGKPKWDEDFLGPSPGLDRCGSWESARGGDNLSEEDGYRYATLPNLCSEKEARTGSTEIVVHLAVRPRVEEGLSTPTRPRECEPGTPKGLPEPRLPCITQSPWDADDDEFDSNVYKDL